MKKSNIIILALIGLTVITGLSFLTGVKKEFYEEVEVYIEGSENLETRDIQIEDFNQVKVFDQITLIVKEGAKSLTFSAEDNILPYMKASVEDGELSMFIDADIKGELRNNKPIIATLSNPNFGNLNSVNQSNIKIEGELNVDSISLMVEDQGQIDGYVNANFIELELDNQSSANISGKTDKLEIDSRSQTNYKTGDLEAKKVLVSMSQQSEGVINVTEELEAQLSQNSKLRYRGDPPVKQVNTTHSASVKKAIL